MDDLSFQELDAKLIELQKSRVPAKNKLSRIEAEMEDLEYDKCEAENELETIDRQIKNISKKIFEAKVKSIDVVTDDQFTNDFIRASYFSNRDSEDGSISFSYVNIADSEIVACTGFMLIKINSDCIPENLKNTRISWDTRTNFEQHINRDVKEIPSYKKILGEAEKTHRLVAEKMKASDFWQAVKDVTHTPETRYRCAMVNFKIGDLNITFNEEYLKTGLMGIGDEEFTIYAYNPITPMILQGTRTTVVLMPIRD